MRNNLGIHLVLYCPYKFKSEPKEILGTHLQTVSNSTELYYYTHDNINFIYKLKELLNFLTFALTSILDDICWMLWDDYDMECGLSILFHILKKLKWTKKTKKKDRKMKFNKLIFN